MNASLKHVYRNLPNIVSILGVLPLFVLLRESAFPYICALIVFNNIMDDLDGILAEKLGLGSDFGARLDNVCDAVAHILIATVVGAHYGGVVLASSLVSVVAILLRVVARLAPSPVSGTGTPTYELMRHLLLLILLQRVYEFDVTPYLVAAYLLNFISMLVPFAMPHLIRAWAQTATAVSLVNVALVIAWRIPATLPFIAAAFLGSYLYSFVVSGVRWLRRA